MDLGDDPFPLVLPREIDSVDYANSLDKTPRDFALRIPVPLHHALFEIKIVAYPPAGRSCVYFMSRNPRAMAQG